MNWPRNSGERTFAHRLVDEGGAFRALRMAPMRMRRFRLERAPAEGVNWLRGVLNRQRRALRTGVMLDERGPLAPAW